MKQKAPLVFTIAALLSAAVTYVVVANVSRGWGSAHFDASMERAAADLNKTLPKMVDKQTRFDAAKAGPGMKFSYFYTLMRATKSQLDAASISQAMRTKLTAAYRDNPKMKNFRDHNVELVYQYRDESSAVICEIAIAPKDFQPAPAQP